MKGKTKITSKKLYEMYEKRKMSSPEIDRLYSCRPERVRYLLREYGIRIRTKSEARQLLFNINIPKNRLRKLYLEREMSSLEIAKTFNCSPGFIRNKLREYKIPIRTVQKALSLSNKPLYKRSDFSGDPEEKAYLMGFNIGDLHVSSKNKRTSTVFVHTNSTIPEQIKLFRKLFSPYGHIWESKPAKNGAICIRGYLNKTFKFLLNRQDRIEPWALKNKNYFAAFLAGYSDAEATFCLCGDNAVFSIKSQDKNILWQIHTKLIKLGILCRPPQVARKQGTKDIGGTVNNKDVWGLWVHRKSALLKLVELLNPYLKHKRKRKEMKIVKENILMRNKKFPTKKDTRWYKLYLVEGINYVGA